MAKLWQGFLRNVTSDLKHQFNNPTRSIVGSICTRRWEKHNQPLIRRVVEATGIQPDHKVLELGYGRGFGLHECYKTVKNGSGCVFGLEVSDYMAASTFKNYSLEIQENDKIVMDKISNLINLPYPNDQFDSVYHIDVFYFWAPDIIQDIFREFYRVLKPGALLICGMELNRLKQLEKYGIVTFQQFDPMRYMVNLEPTGFRNVKIEYEHLSDSPNREIQLITARKPEASTEYYDPDYRMRQLELDIKKHLAMQSLMETQRRDEELIRDIREAESQDNNKTEEELQKKSNSS
ncbi:hypothetical protein M3Y94_01248500 [Aphelenchoides besseyi]|nr:hypothetical protein M3Y94_01248500 [Aphelenchoides besseyi]KAI6219384.1 Methyltransferase [Aphelenchoides besseyi]